MCQASARMPHLKYQNQGGPSPQEIIGLIREHSSSRMEDETRFVDVLIFNWLISGTDAHSKNYSFLIAPRGQVRLAPLYDLSSALPYARQIPPRDATLAMKIGGKYKLLAIGAREWDKLAAELRIDFDALHARLSRSVRLFVKRRCESSASRLRGAEEASLELYAQPWRARSKRWTCASRSMNSLRASKPAMNWQSRRPSKRSTNRTKQPAKWGS